ncbi:MAG: hypothetical protein LQ350_002460 [Teloschistes chrysophthalmus]|nr:MAG: hypothetical protein LQ350_002460 [Niorma chrysophthalma]
MVAGSPAKEVGKVTGDTYEHLNLCIEKTQAGLESPPGNPALKMQHWMKNQLVKESYTDKWEDIVRSGNAQHAASPDASSQTKLPAEFGTKDKVPAPGTAPMGLSDYKDSRQWADRKQQLEQQGSGDPSKGSEKSTSPKGYLGGDGAQVAPASETTSNRPQEPKQQSVERSNNPVSGRNQDSGQAPKDAQASASGQGNSEQSKQSNFANSGHRGYSSNGATPSSSSAQTNGAARHIEESIGDASQLQARSRSLDEAASGSNGASSRSGNASNKQQTPVNSGHKPVVSREAQDGVTSQKQQDAAVSSAQQAGRLSDAQQQQPEVLQQKPLRETSQSQDEPKAQQQQQQQEQQQQRKGRRFGRQRTSFQRRHFVL